MKSKQITFLDCTLRDGGYYNNWDFSQELIEKYLEAMVAAKIDIVELGLRSLINNGYKGACAYTTDDFIRSLNIPSSLKIGIMINASELINKLTVEENLSKLIPNVKKDSPVDLVRVACHYHEFAKVLPAVNWLKSRGFSVGFNLMQIAERSGEEIRNLARVAKDYEIDALYFADSMGSLKPKQIVEIVHYLREEWKGALGIHTHDNLGLALSNTLRAIEEGVTWVDATVTGMGRGPGNARTEELAIEISEIKGVRTNMVPLMTLIRSHFQEMQNKFKWGTNPYYYLAGKYGLHPTYIQEMLADSRYGEVDILAVIEHLRIEGGKKYNSITLDSARQFYEGAPKGDWEPANIFAGNDVLLLGTGPGVQTHKKAIESFINKNRPIVLAMNTQTSISSKLIDYRIACHPVRLLADCEAHTKLPQPLITPFSMLGSELRSGLRSKAILDFGLQVKPEQFDFQNTHCIIPSSLVMAYAFAVLTSGKANKILLAGFDGYSGEDARNTEMNSIVKTYQANEKSVPLIGITPTRYDIPTKSIYGLI